MKRTNKINRENNMAVIRDLVNESKIIKEVNTSIELYFFSENKDAIDDYLDEIIEFIEKYPLEKKDKNYKFMTVVETILYGVRLIETLELDCLDEFLDDCKRFIKNRIIIENFKKSHNIKRNPFAESFVSNPNMLDNNIQIDKVLPEVINNIIPIIKQNRKGSFKLPDEIISILNNMPSKINDTLIDIIWGERTCPYFTTFDCEGYVANESKPIYDLISYIENDTMSNYFELDLSDKQLYDVLNIILSNMPKTDINNIKDEYVFNGMVITKDKKKYTTTTINDEREGNK